MPANQNSKKVTLALSGAVATTIGYLWYKFKQSASEDNQVIQRKKPKVIIYIAMTIDGYIADVDGSVDFLDKYQNTEDTGYNYNDFYQTISSVIVGRSTFEKMLTFDCDFPHNSKDCYILSNNKNTNDYKHLFDAKKIDANKIHFSNEMETNTITELIEKMKENIKNNLNNNGNIYCDGGGNVITQLINLGLIDEYKIFVIPEILGNGISLFQNVKKSKVLKLIHHKQYKSGIVELVYQKC